MTVGRHFPGLDISFQGGDDLNSRFFPPEYVFFGHRAGFPLLLFRQNSSKDLIRQDYPGFHIEQSWLADQQSEIMNELQEAVPSKSIWNRHLRDLLADTSDERAKQLNAFGEGLIDSIDTVAMSALCAFSCSEVRMEVPADSVSHIGNDLVALVILECASQLIRQAGFGEKNGAGIAKRYASSVEAYLRETGQAFGDDTLEAVKIRVQAARFKARSLIDKRDYR